MRTLLIAVLSLVTTCAAYCQSERKVSSTIREVTVFLQGAQVTRTALVEIKPGQSTIVLNGTSPRIQENSIQAEADQNVKILGVSFRINHLEDLKQPEASSGLISEKDRLQKLVSDERAAIEIFNEEEQMLKANKVIGGQQSGVNVDDLKSAVDYYRQRLLDILENKRQINLRIENFEASIRRVEAQITEMKVVKPRPEGEIVIKMESKVESRIKLKVSYMVQEASWFPLYDIRAKDIKSPIAITYKANITQQSGEDWENIKIAVSSANPSATGARPVITPWILGFNNHVGQTGSFDGDLEGRLAGVTVSGNGVVHGRVLDENGAPLPGVNVIVKGTSNGTTTDINGQYSMNMPSGDRNGVLVFSFIGYQSQEVRTAGSSLIDVALNPDVMALSEVIVTGYGGSGGAGYSGYSQGPKIRQTIAATPVVRSTNLEFTIDTPYTIRSGGENQVVDMIEYEVDAQYQYYCAPKLDADAFLIARLTNWDEYNFMEGQASLFFEGKYIGKTILDTRNTSDTLTLSLGRDRNVVITRDKVKEYSADQFVGSNRKALFAYEINIRNKKAYPIDIRIEDQYPVPNTKDITVNKIEDSGAIEDEENGLLTWNLKVNPGKTGKIDLRYEIKYPRYRNIILE
jgi:hypothetical protein